MRDLPAAFLRRPIAHRGLHDRSRRVIENSRAAVAAAVAGGFGVEIDVQRAACGEAMVFHDDDLPRLTGVAGALRDRTAAELAAIPLIDGDETVPTLAEVLRLVAGRAPLLIEVKDQTRRLGPDVGPLEARVATLLAGYAGPVAVMSFNPRSVGAMAEAAPAVTRGLTSCAFARDDWDAPLARREALADLRDFDAVGASFISHDHTDLGNRAVARVKARGVPVLTWTIRSAAQEAAARRVADNVTFEGYKPVSAD